MEDLEQQLDSRYVSQSPSDDTNYNNWVNNSWKADNFQTPLGWFNSAIAPTLGAAGQSVFGCNNAMVLGVNNTYVTGVDVTSVFNPIGMLGLSSTAPAGLEGASTGQLFGLAAGGYVQVVFGANVGLNYGTTLTCCHGATWSINGAPSLPSKLVGVLYVIFHNMFILALAAFGDSTRDKFITDLVGNLLGNILLTLVLKAEKAERDKQVTKQTADAQKRAQQLTTDLTDVSASLTAAGTEFAASVVVAGLSKKLKKLTEGDSHELTFRDGTIVKSAANVHLIASKKAATQKGPHVIMVTAEGNGSNGTVLVNGTKSVGLASGVCALALEKAGDVTLQSSAKAAAKLTLQRKGPKENIVLSKNSILVDAGSQGTVEVKAKDIKLTASGDITLGGKNIKIEGTTKVELKVNDTNLILDAKSIANKALKLSHKVELQMETQATMLKQAVDAINEIKATLDKRN